MNDNSVTNHSYNALFLTLGVSKSQHCLISFVQRCCELNEKVTTTGWCKDLLHISVELRHMRNACWSLFLKMSIYKHNKWGLGKNTVYCPQSSGRTCWRQTAFPSIGPWLTVSKNMTWKKFICGLWELRAALHMLSRLRTAASRRTCPATWTPLMYGVGGNDWNGERCSLHENGKPTYEALEPAQAVITP